MSEAPPPNAQGPAKGPNEGTGHAPVPQTQPEPNKNTRALLESFLSQNMPQNNKPNQEQPETGLTAEQKELKKIKSEHAKLLKEKEAREQANMTAEQKELATMKKELTTLAKEPLLQKGFTEEELAEFDYNQLRAMSLAINKVAGSGNSQTPAQPQKPQPPSSNPNPQAGKQTNPNTGKIPYARDPRTGDLLYR